MSADAGAPIVVKADGLAAGKGVIVAATTRRGARRDRRRHVGEGKFGAAGAEVVVEEFLEGEEASFFALVDGKHALPLASAQDHKRVGDGDTGPNTGGMGAYSPAPALTPDARSRGDGDASSCPPSPRWRARAGRSRACSMPG